jgi:hypothetical protein
MSNPHNYLSDLLESVLTDRTSEMDDVHTDPHEYQGPPGEEVLVYYPENDPNSPEYDPEGPVTFPTDGPNPDPGPAEDPGPIVWEDYPPGRFPMDENPDPWPDQGGPNPDEGYDPDAPAPEDPAPEPDPYEGKNCWEVPDLEEPDTTPSENPDGPECID